MTTQISRSTEGTAMLRSRLILGLVSACLLIGQADAAPPPAPAPVSVFGNSATLAVTTASANVALPGDLKKFPVVQVLNTGLSTVFVKVGDASVSVTATYAANIVPITSGSAVSFWVSDLTNDHIAAIVASGSSSILVYQWNGLPGLSGSGGGGGSGGGSGPFTPTKIGGVSQIGGTPVVLITAGQCVHACEIQDVTAGGFWIDQTGGTPTAGVSEWYPAGSLWYSPVGLTTAVTIIPFNTGILTGVVQ